MSFVTSHSCSISDHHLQVFREIEVKGFDGSLFETKQVFYPSKDGTKIPMFITHRKVRWKERKEGSLATVVTLYEINRHL